MKLSTLMTIAVAASVATGVPQAAGAADAPRPDPFAQMIAARTVADYARRTKDAHAMIVAARMLGEIPVQGAEGDAGFTPTGLFAEARTLAGSDAALIEQIRIAETTGRRGVFSSDFGRGLVRSVQVVNPRANYQFRVNARAREPLRIGAIGDVGTSLMMRVMDKGGKLVCLDDQGDYAPVCQTRPAADGVYRVDIVNKSPARSRTVILSN